MVRRRLLRVVYAVVHDDAALSVMTATVVAVCLDADALIKTLFPGLVLTPKMKISPE